MIVLDASAVVELVLNSDAGALVRERIVNPAVTLHAPHLLSIEVAQVLRRFVTARSITPEIGEAALADAAQLDIARYAHEPFLDRMWQLRGNVTAYDAVYLALAEVLECPLLTFDGKLAGAPGHGASIELLTIES